MSSYTFNGKAIGWYREVLETRARELAELVRAGGVPLDVVALQPEEFAGLVRDELARLPGPA